jgi:hypothetical protein
LHGTPVAHVQVDGMNGGSAAFQGEGGDFGQFSSPASGKQHARSLGGKGEGGGGPYAGAGARDEDNFPVEAHDFILRLVDLAEHRLRTHNELASVSCCGCRASLESRMSKFPVQFPYHPADAFHMVGRLPGGKIGFIDVEQQVLGWRANP